MTREPATAVSADDRATPSRGSERMTCDVAVVGASLAGCTVATLLGRLGLRVVLIEMHADPRAYKRICTHFIQASGTPVLERLGIARQLEALGAVRNRIDIWTRGAGSASKLEPTSRFPSGTTSVAASSIPRSESARAARREWSS